MFIEIDSPASAAIARRARRLPPDRERRRLKARALAPALAAVLLLPACSSAGSTGSGRPGGERALNVQVATVTEKDIAYSVQALGSLEAEELVQVTAEVEGAVSEILFHEGDRVTADTVLARIDPERYRLEAARSEATHRKAVADWQQAVEEVKRREVLAQDELVSVEELTRARMSVERLAAEAAAAKAAHDIALQNVKRSDVRAPRAGVINTRSVETGQFMRIGTAIATLVNIDRLRLRFKVSEAESLRSKTGQPVTFRVAPLGNRDFEAQVYHVGDVADAATRQVEVLAWVNNPGMLKPGFFAEVKLATESHKGAIAVPEGAVQASERGFVAYVVEDGKARQRPLQIGLRTGDGNVEILSGLKPGDRVVTAGSDRLADGISVQAVDAGAESGAGGTP